MSYPEVVIVSGARTPIGRFQGALSAIPAVELGGVAIKAAIERAGIDGALVEEVLMGNVVQAGEGQAPARQAGIAGGLPVSVGATTINKICGSGLKAVMMAAQAIRSGDGDVFVAGGMENMNLAPYYLTKARTGYRMGNAEMIDGMIHDGLWCAFEHHHMGSSAEWIAREYGVSRQDQDELALRSHQRAVAAIDAGRFKAEIAPVPIAQRKGPPLLFDADETPRRDSSLEALAKLKPAFEAGGTVTAGNAPPISDGAAALVVMSGQKAAELGLKPLARVTAYAQAAVKPLEIFAAPIFAVRRLMDRLGVGIDHFDLIEVNEAFAAQTIADGRTLGMDWDKVNVNGGAVALGHPIGCSGARVLVTLLYALQHHQLKTGLATLCLGGGEGVALSVEMLD
ncbi:MAG TPA: acetyl-CoA C-acetyltransferase [Anaerolineae bacterium]|nr:acetyl-CoA C-acetyltransferase [Anaerolineae bacterium]HNU05384.1 acetyl-CoA C-acetyltransferase [Anaerolineae bacterium]